MSNTDLTQLIMILNTLGKELFNDPSEQGELFRRIDLANDLRLIKFNDYTGLWVRG